MQFSKKEKNTEQVVNNIYMYIYMYIYIYIYIIAETKRKWIPTIKEVVTNRKKDPFKNWHV